MGIEQASDSLFEFPGRGHQTDRGLILRSRRELFGNGEERPRIGGCIGVPEDHVIANLLSGPNEDPIQPMDERVGPIDGLDDPLRHADEGVSPTDMGELVVEDMAQLSRRQRRQERVRKDDPRTKHARHDWASDRIRREHESTCSSFRMRKQSRGGQNR